MMMSSAISRRGLLAGISATAASAVAPGAMAASGTLGSAAQGVGVLFGAAAGNQIYTDPAYEALFRETRLMTSEWQFKMAALQPSRGVCEF